MKARKQFAQDNQNTTQCIGFYKVKRGKIFFPAKRI